MTEHAEGLVTFIASKSLSGSQMRSLAIAFKRIVHDQYDPEAEVALLPKRVELVAGRTAISRLQAEIVIAAKISAQSPTLEVDLQEGRLSVNGRDAFLTPVELRLMRVLVPQGSSVSMETLTTELAVTEVALRSYTLRIRRKLGTFSHALYTHRGYGYGFAVSDRIIVKEPTP